MGSSLRAYTHAGRTSQKTKARRSSRIQSQWPGVVDLGGPDGANVHGIRVQVVHRCRLPIGCHCRGENSREVGGTRILLERTQETYGQVCGCRTTTIDVVILDGRTTQGEQSCSVHQFQEPLPRLLVSSQGTASETKGLALSSCCSQT